MTKPAALATIVAVLLAVPAPAHAHLGGLDAFGGHHCWTSCWSRGYYYGAYICHTRLCPAVTPFHMAYYEPWDWRPR